MNHHHHHHHQASAAPATSAPQPMSFTKALDVAESLEKSGRQPQQPQQQPVSILRNAGQQPQQQQPQQQPQQQHRQGEQQDPRESVYDMNSYEISV